MDKVTGTSPMLTAMERMEIKSFADQERERIRRIREEHFEILQRIHEASMHTHEKAMKLFNQIKPIEMKTLKIEIPEGHEIDQENSTFDKIVFKEVKSNYPLKVEDIPNRDWALNSIGNVLYFRDCSDTNQLSTEERAKAFLALMQLVELRDAWNEIDGGKDFTCEDIKHTINIYFNEAVTNTEISTYRVLHFRKEETRDKFLETFIDLINQAKELI